MQAFILRVWSRGLIPIEEQLLALLFVQQGQTADERVRLGDRGLQESLEVSGKLFD